MGSLQTYRDNLRHVVRPDDPSERSESDGCTMSDYEALALQRMLRAYQAYSAPTDDRREIAGAFIEYIDMVVRDEERRQVDIYAHTSEAKEVLQDALLCHADEASVVLPVPEF